jgi:hypothetical protein
LAAPPGFVAQGKVARGPAPPPMANRVGVQVNLLAGGDVGQARVVVPEENQGGPLAQLKGHGPAPDDLPGRGDEVRGKRGPVGR